MIDIDLDKIVFEKKISIEVNGWHQIEIEYSIRAFSGISWLLWRVSGTSHIFQIQYQIVLTKHQGILIDHFRLVLETFLEDYKQWQKEETQEAWMINYLTMFQAYIK